MPRVVMVANARASKKSRRCSGCHEEIKVGEAFYTWSFRYGGQRWRHCGCGRPRQSELTQSLMSSVYAAVEAYEDLGEDAGWEEKADAMEELVNVIEEVAGQYESAAESFGNAGENQERYEALEGWQQEVSEAAEKMRAAADAISEAEDAGSIVGECPL